MARKMSNEEAVAKRIADLTDKITLDLDEVGKHIARMQPATYYNRLMVIAESAEWEKEQIPYQDERKW